MNVYINTHKHRYLASIYAFKIRDDLWPGQYRSISPSTPTIFRPDYFDFLDIFSRVFFCLVMSFAIASVKSPTHINFSISSPIICNFLLDFLIYFDV